MITVKGIAAGEIKDSIKTDQRTKAGSNIKNVFGLMCAGTKNNFVI